MAGSDQHSAASFVGGSTYSLFIETFYTAPFPTSLAMLSIVIVLVLLTALVATEPSSPGDSDQ